ncbi:MAG: DUF4199 domain-containing protein [Prevotella sp.]|nr:DUF4199 domain-containing protein [Prevotella sp.]
MVRPEDIMQVKAFARQDGAFLSLLWIASFACIVFATGSSIGNLLMIATPFFVGWRLVSFREYALDGIISFRRGYMYSVYTFFYASLIFMFAQYVYFKFLDHGNFFNMMRTAVNTLTPIYQQYGMNIEEIKEALESMSTLGPIQWSFMFMMQNISIGFIISIFIAMICVKKAKTKK